MLGAVFSATPGRRTRHPPLAAHGEGALAGPQPCGHPKCSRRPAEGTSSQHTPDTWPFPEEEEEPCLQGITNHSNEKAAPVPVFVAVVWTQHLVLILGNIPNSCGSQENTDVQDGSTTADPRGRAALLALLTLEIRLTLAGRAGPAQLWSRTCAANTFRGRPLGYGGAVSTVLSPHADAGAPARRLLALLSGAPRRGARTAHLEQGAPPGGAAKGCGPASPSRWRRAGDTTACHTPSLILRKLVCKH